MLQYMFCAGDCTHRRWLESILVLVPLYLFRSGTMKAMTSLDKLRQAKTSFCQ